MGAHPDNGIIHALHSWKTRAKRAEEKHDNAVEALESIRDALSGERIDQADVFFAYDRAVQALKEIK